MSNKMPISELRRHLDAVVERSEKYLDITHRDRSNPQIAQMRERTKGKLDIASAVLEAIGGSATVKPYGGCSIRIESGLSVEDES